MTMSRTMRVAFAGLTLLGAAASAMAGGHNYGPYPSYYGEECGSCHVPYPAQLMTQAGWVTQIKGLKNHFGSDASVDAPASQTILAYLVNNAAWKSKFAPTDPAARLTKTAWFVKEHGKTPPKGKGFSDCAQCHAQALQGEYDEHKLTVPAGWRRIR